MQDTSRQYDTVIEKCRSLFKNKMTNSKANSKGEKLTNFSNEWLEFIFDGTA